MDEEQFRTAAHQLVDYMISYLQNIRTRRVLSNVTPGYMRELIPGEAPEQGESWQDIFRDIEQAIMPGITHWQSPNFHAYYPAGNSWPAMLGDMLSGAIGCVGFTWIASPACTELEVIVMDWLGKLIHLPPVFLAESGGKGGGVIQVSASEAALTCLLAARSKKLKRMKIDNPELDEKEATSRLIVYISDQTHCSGQKAALLAGVDRHIVPTDDDFRLRGSALRSAILEDKAAGKIPFFVMSTLGTTASCAFDDLAELGPVCAEEEVWLHVDAAYAGSAFICEEFRHLMKGIEMVDSFNFNPHKLLMVNFDCSGLWVKNSDDLVEAFQVDPLYLRDENRGSIPEFRHWQIHLGRRFRALKLWFVMRCYGAEGLRAHIRRQIQLAGHFHRLMMGDDRFEFPVQPAMGLVCFRLKGDNSRSEALLKQINDAGKVHMTPSKLRDLYVIRMAICSRYTEESDVEVTWTEIKRHTDQLAPSKLT